MNEPKLKFGRGGHIPKPPKLPKKPDRFNLFVEEFMPVIWTVILFLLLWLWWKAI